LEHLRVREKMLSEELKNAEKENIDLKFLKENVDIKLERLNRKIRDLEEAKKPENMV
jgi:hypothetical protein